EGKKFGDASLSYGSFKRAEAHVSLGDHTDKFAYYISGAGNRTDLGLERVDIPVLHDNANGFSGLTSLIYNISPKDQLRFVTSGRRDHYRVPNIVAQQRLGIDDTEIATDAFSNFTWVHTYDSGALLTISPFYHFNRGQYIVGPNDPLV